jgi:integrase
VRLHLKPVLGGVRLDRLSPADVQALLNAKQATGLSPASIQRIRATLRAALNQAMRWGMVSRNAAALVRGPSVKRPEVEPFSIDESRRLLETARGHRLEALITVALAVGLRQGEALALAWDDVDLDDGTITVRRTLQRVDRRLVYAEPKTEKGVSHNFGQPDLVVTEATAFPDGPPCPRL